MSLEWPVCLHHPDHRHRHGMEHNDRLTTRLAAERSIFKVRKLGRKAAVARRVRACPMYRLATDRWRQRIRCRGCREPPDSGIMKNGQSADPLAEGYIFQDMTAVRALWTKPAAAINKIVEELKDDGTASHKGFGEDIIHLDEVIETRPSRTAE